jgi:hypothetical protein
VAVSSPEDDRLDAIREVTGEQTHFVLISDGTLDALLGSRMFADAPSVSAARAAAAKEAQKETEAAPEPPVAEEIDPVAGPAAAARRKRRSSDEGEAFSAEEPTPVEEEAAPPEVEAPPEPAAEVSAPAPDAAVDNIVGAVLNALKHRGGSTVESPSADAQADAAALPSSTAELLTHLDATVETWSALRATLANVHTEFEETKRALRDTKEQLSVAHADNDQYRKRVRMLEGELAESRELVGQARTRLLEAAELLDADPTLREPAELLQ